MEEKATESTQEEETKKDQKAPEEGNAHNDMLSPYSNLPPRKSHSKSPRRKDSLLPNTNSQNLAENAKDLTDYLSSQGEIKYPDLISDEISKVDENLLKASKSDRQVGGKF